MEGSVELQERRPELERIEALAEKEELDSFPERHLVGRPGHPRQGLAEEDRFDGGLRLRRVSE